MASADTQTRTGPDTGVMTPGSRCPQHVAALSGGPVLWYCPAGHSVYAADLQDAEEAAVRHRLSQAAESPHPHRSRAAA